MKISKNQIRKLGKRLRIEKVDGIDPIDIDSLEKYRISYKESVSRIFNKLYQESKATRHDSITTYRLKRIESIVRKLFRYPEMDLDRMWDVAGCRCILNTQDKVYKLRERLFDNFNVIKENDYYKNPTATGYKSIHLYLTETEDDKWPIEIQLRTQYDHNWATLVEIIDQLFGKNLKEGEEDFRFDNFFKLMSNLRELDVTERVYLINLTHELSVFHKLYSVFIQNYLRVRLNWLEISKPKNHHFFVIEVVTDQPQIASFNSFGEAEKNYFEKFNSTSGSNIVLTYLPQSNFENLEKAYSNYTLTAHTFIDDYFRLLSDVCNHLMKLKKYGQFYRLFKYAQENIYRTFSNIQNEYEYLEKPSIKKKAKYWKKDFDKRIKRRSNQLIQLTKGIERLRPTSGIDLLKFKFYNWRISRRERRFRKSFFGE